MYKKDFFFIGGLFLVLLSPLLDKWFETAYIITTLTTFIFCVILWITNYFPASVTGIILIILFSINGSLPFEQASSGLGDPVVWLVISVLIISIAVQQYQFDLHIAYNLLILAKGSKKLVLLILIIISFILTFIIPNAVARLTILLSITKGIIERSENIKDPNFTKACMLLVTYAPYMGTVTVFTGASGSIYAIGLFSEMLQYEWSYLYWLALMIPSSLASLAFLWFLLLYRYPLTDDNLKLDEEYFITQKKQLKKLNYQSYYLLFVVFLLILLWMTSTVHHISLSLSAMICMILLFIPRANVLNWKSTLTKIDWSVPLLFAAGLAIAKAFQNSGVLDLASDVISDYAVNHSLALFILIMVTILLIIRFFFTNFNSIVASILPIILIVAQQMNINPIWLGMFALYIMSMAYILPTQSIGNMMMAAEQYYTTLDLIKTGFILTVVMTLIIFFVTFFYWPLIGVGIN